MALESKETGPDEIRRTAPAYALNVLRLGRLRILESAYRHGLTGNEIRHAWTNAVGFFDIDLKHEPIKSLCIGPDGAGNLLEILYLQLEGEDLVIHAMPLRPAFGALLTGD